VAGGGSKAVNFHSIGCAPSHGGRLSNLTSLPLARSLFPGAGFSQSVTVVPPHFAAKKHRMRRLLDRLDLPPDCAMECPPPPPRGNTSCVLPPRDPGHAGNGKTGEDPSTAVLEPPSRPNHNRSSTLSSSTTIAHCVSEVGGNTVRRKSLVAMETEMSIL